MDKPYVKEFVGSLEQRCNSMIHLVTGHNQFNERGNPICTWLSYHMKLYNEMNENEPTTLYIHAHCAATTSTKADNKIANLSKCSEWLRILHVPLEDRLFFHLPPKYIFIYIFVFSKITSICVWPCSLQWHLKKTTFVV